MAWFVVVKSTAVNLKSLLLILFVLAALFAKSSKQAPCVDSLITIANYSEIKLALIAAQFPKAKYPQQFKAQVLIALQHFPELATCNIEFVLKETITPLSARPSICSVFRSSKKRSYLITISSKTDTFLAPILLQNLSFNAQIGVLGHEISHVVYYQNKNTFQLLRMAIGQLSRSYTDRFESATDKRCIDHQLGYQLLNWSREVRQKLKLEQWKGAQAATKTTPTASERYLSPHTILSIISTHHSYTCYE